MTNLGFSSRNFKKKLTRGMEDMAKERRTRLNIGAIPKFLHYITLHLQVGNKSSRLVLIEQSDNFRND